MSPRPQHASPSRTAVPRESPLEWIFAQGPGFDVMDEVAAVFAGLPEFETEIRKEELFDVLDLARMGKLTDENMLVPIRLDPVMWELRFSFTQGVYRLYFGEPDAHPEVLVATRFHLKDTSGTDSEIQERQDREMQVASDRFQEGLATRWGL